MKTDNIWIKRKYIKKLLNITYTRTYTRTYANTYAWDKSTQASRMNLGFRVVVVLLPSSISLSRFSTNIRFCFNIHWVVLSSIFWAVLQRAKLSSFGAVFKVFDIMHLKFRCKISRLCTSTNCNLGKKTSQPNL